MKMKFILFFAFFTVLLGKNLEEFHRIKMNEKISSIITTDQGKKVEIVRIQDTAHKLTDDFAKTSRECPPYCIQPTKIHKDIKNVAELEVLSFIENYVNKHRGILVDTRLKSWFELESIPSAINIPYVGVQGFSKKSMKKLFVLLGKKEMPDGSWNFSDAKKMLIFDNGIWCAQAQYFVDALLKYNYPTDKIIYYRAGLQGWKLLGLTTVVHKAEIVD